jgi:hypothetical protein
MWLRRIINENKLGESKEHKNQLVIASVSFLKLEDVYEIMI